MHENAAADATISRSPSFTTDDLVAAGVLTSERAALIGKLPPESLSEHVERAWNATGRHAAMFGRDQEALVRLALAHPAKAGEALGPGWSTGGRFFNWQAPVAGLFLRVAEGHVQLSASGVTLPPEFLPALQRAYLIATAWGRIENGGGL